MRHASGARRRRKRTTTPRRRKRISSAKQLGLARPKKKRRASTLYQAKDAPTIRVVNGKVVMLLPRRLRGLNSRGGHWAEAGERKAWELMLTTAEFATDGSVVLPVTCRRRLEIIRLAPHRRYLLDKTNLDACGKRLEDALVALGYLVDDDRFGVDGPHITQGVSRDRCYWAVVTLLPAVPYVDETVTLDAKELGSRACLHTRKTPSRATGFRRGSCIAHRFERQT